MKKKKKKITLIIIAAAVVLICAFFALRAGSFHIALQTKGFDTEVVVIDQGDKEYSRRKYKVVQTTEDGDNGGKRPVILQLSKDFLGFWQIDNRSAPVGSGEPQVVEFAWFGDGSTGNVNTPMVIHTACYGTNAVKEIEFLPGQIPENVAVSIRQEGERYWIHITSSGDFAFVNNLWENLMKTGCFDFGKWEDALK